MKKLLLLVTMLLSQTMAQGVYLTATQSMVNFFQNIVVDKDFALGCVGCDFTGIDFTETVSTFYDNSGDSHHYPEGINLKYAHKTLGSFIDNSTGVNFSGSNFTGATMPSGLVLNSPNFSRANFTSAHFMNAHLNSPNFYAANLSYAHFAGSMIKGSASDIAAAAKQVSFKDTALYGADFTTTTFESINFTNAGFSGTKIGKAIFSHCIVNQLISSQSTMNASGVAAPRYVGLHTSVIDGNWVIFEYCQMSGVQLSGMSGTGGTASFAGASFNYSDLTNANLSGSDFSGANFTGAQLRNLTLLNLQTNKTTKELKGSNFTGANFTGATLTAGTVTDCIFDKANFTNASIVIGYLSGGSIQNANLSKSSAWIVSFATPTIKGPGTFFSTTNTKGTNIAITTSMFKKGSTALEDLMNISSSGVGITPAHAPIYLLNLARVFWNLNNKDICALAKSDLNITSDSSYPTLSCSGISALKTNIRYNVCTSNSVRASCASIPRYRPHR